MSVERVQSVDGRTDDKDDFVRDGIVGHVGDLAVDRGQRNLSFDLSLKIGDVEE